MEFYVAAVQYTHFHFLKYFKGQLEQIFYTQRHFFYPFYTFKPFAFCFCLLQITFCCLDKNFISCSFVLKLSTKIDIILSVLNIINLNCYQAKPTNNWRERASLTENLELKNWVSL